MLRLFTSVLEHKDHLYCMVPIHIKPLEEIFETKRDADKARVFLQHLFIIRQYMQDNDKKFPSVDRKTRWCPASALNLRALISEHEAIVKTLCEHNIIEILLKENGKPFFIPGKLPIQYRVIFPKHLLKAGARKYRREKITTEGVVRKVGEYYGKRYERHRKKVLKRTPWLEPGIQFLDELTLELPSDPYKSIKDYTGKTDKRASDFINGRGWFLTQDYYAGRFYSQISSLPKILRPYLRHSSGDKIILLDIKACQPFLLSALFHKPQIINLIPEFTELYPRIALHSNSPSTKQFYRRCSKGEFYSHLMDARDLEKEDLKDLLFGHVFYASLYKYEDQPEIGLERWHAQRMFWTYYLDPFRTLLSLKRTKRADIPRADAYLLEKDKDYHLYSTPNLMATKIEVEILLNRITKQCLDKGIGLTTIHDAWLLKEKDLNEFLGIYNRTFQELSINAPEYEIKHEIVAT